MQRACPQGRGTSECRPVEPRDNGSRLASSHGRVGAGGCGSDVAASQPSVDASPTLTTIAPWATKPVSTEDAASTADARHARCVRRERHGQQTAAMPRTRRARGPVAPTAAPPEPAPPVASPPASPPPTSPSPSSPPAASPPSSPPAAKSAPCERSRESSAGQSSAGEPEAHESSAFDSTTGEPEAREPVVCAQLLCDRCAPEGSGDGVERLRGRGRPAKDGCRWPLAPGFGASGQDNKGHSQDKCSSGACDAPAAPSHPTPPTPPEPAPPPWASDLKDLLNGLLGHH